MSEIPPDHSVVGIKSYRYGAYLTACPDHKSIILQQVDDPNKLPQNCRWTVHRKPLFGYSSFETIKFKSCYGTYLTVKGYIWREICQDKFVTNFSKLAFATWTYDQVGTAHVGASHGHDGFRLMVTQSGYYLCAKDYGQVCLYYSPFFLCTQPEVYWTFHPVGRDGTTNIAPTIPRALGTCSVVDDDHEHDHRCGKGITIINNVGVPVYNHSTVNETGRNININGNQHNGGVIAGNKKLIKNEITPP